MKHTCDFCTPEQIEEINQRRSARHRELREEWKLAKRKRDEEEPLHTENNDQYRPQEEPRQEPIQEWKKELMNIPDFEWAEVDAETQHLLKTSPEARRKLLMNAASHGLAGSTSPRQDLPPSRSASSRDSNPIVSIHAFIADSIADIEQEAYEELANDISDAEKEDAELNKLRQDRLDSQDEPQSWACSDPSSWEEPPIKKTEDTPHG
jgi:hypothetical protein